MLDFTHDDLGACSVGAELCKFTLALNFVS